MIKPSASISNITFSGGGSFDFKTDEKVIIVGANNSGKSKFLREIVSIVSEKKDSVPLVIESLTLKKVGGVEDLKNFLNENAVMVSAEYRYNNWKLPVNSVSFWGGAYLPRELHAGFIRNITADERLVICQQQNSISPSAQKTKPQHILYDSDVLMSKVNALFKRAFSKDLIFDFRGGSKIPIHVGDLSCLSGLADRASDKYVEAVRVFPLLDEQGDGMKSYAGILFEAVAVNLDITLIDEPEAFMHPPQMRRLGETLSSEVNGQLFVSTHSSDILRGFLEGTRGVVRILRVSREGRVNVVSEASSDVIKELWNKPELRYSNALEGIFHEQTIICEDDSDCRLINSVADYLANDSSAPWVDTAYVPTGGKHGIPKVASVLRRIGVPVKAVFDMDFLSEKTLVQSSVDAFGGDWTAIEPLWMRLDAAVRSGAKPKTPTEIKAEIISILESAESDDLPKNRIIESMKQGKAWSDVKRFGFRGIPSGTAQDDYERLKYELENIGIYLVPVGEIENFCPSVGLHGPKFVTKLLGDVSLGDEKLNDLRAFVSRVHKGKIRSGDTKS